MSWPVRAGALLIDLDGTLVDSSASIMRAWCRWAGQYGADPGLIARIMPGRTADAVMRQVRPGLPDPVLASEQRELLEWQIADTGGVTAMPGAAGLLGALPADRWAVVTSGSDRLARARLRAARLPVPAVLVDCNAVAAGKPDPAGYLAAAARLGAPPSRCLVIEDAPSGIAAGHAAGMQVLAVPPAAPGGAERYLPSLSCLRVQGCDDDGSLVISRAAR